MTRCITIPTREIAAVARWADIDHDKAPTHWVLFAKGEFIATDGHRLVRVPCETNGLAFAVDSSHLLAACAAQSGLPFAREITLAPEDKAHVALGIAHGVSLRVPRRDPDAFHNVDSVMPSPGGDGPPDGYVLDPRFLAAIAEVNAATNPDVHRGVRLVSWQPGRSVRGPQTGAMMLENGRGVRFVLMPMRDL